MSVFDHQHYDRCIANGCSPALAEMLAARKFPGVRGTDRAFLQGLHAEEEDGTLLAYRRDAEAAGVSTTGKKYISGLADRPGDPRAWVSGLDDVRSVLAERGWGCTGALSVPGDPVEPVAATPGVVASDLVAREVRERIEADPSLAPRREALAHEVRREWSRSEALPEFDDAGWVGEPDRGDAGEEWA
jgi:hypothetical protein